MRRTEHPMFSGTVSSCVVSTTPQIVVTISSWLRTTFPGLGDSCAPAPPLLPVLLQSSGKPVRTPSVC